MHQAESRASRRDEQVASPPNLGERFRAAHEACHEGPLLARQAVQMLVAQARSLASTARLSRLSALVELWDCLKGDEPAAGEEVRHFLQDALSQLAGLDPSRWEDAAELIVAESSDRWGEYLGLIDPNEAEAEEPRLADMMEAPVEAAESVDAATLFALLTGQRPAPSPPPAVPPSRETGPQAMPIPPPLPPAPASATKPALAVDLDPRLRDVFLEEAAELFERIQTHVLELGGGDDGEQVGELKRCLHTLKGAALSVGLKALGTTAHQAEDRINEAEDRIDAELIAYLEAVLTEIEDTLAALRDGYSPAPASESTSPNRSAPPPSPRVEGPTKRPPNAPPPVTTTRSETTAEATPQGEGDGTLRVPAARVDELMDLVSEMLVRRRFWQEQVTQIGRWSDTARSASSRLRATIDSLAISGGRNRGLTDLLRALTEQAEDLAVLAESARAAISPAGDEAEALGRVGLKLWDGLQSVRIVPIKGLLQRLVRVARDAARVEGRNIEVRTIGEDTGLDRSTQDRAFEPLLHLVRNAVGHGIEPAEERARVGKDPTGRLVFEAGREGNAVLIRVEDDGRGLDHARIEAKARRLGLIEPDERPDVGRLNNMIFQSGFSTRDQANEVAGRGIGMDVVAREVSRLHGSIELTTRPGRGTTFTIRLPARLALEQAIVVRVDGQPFGLPIDAIETTRDAMPSSSAAGLSTTMDARRLLGFPAATGLTCPTLLVVRVEGRAAALKVDAIDGPRELIVRPLGPMLVGHPALDGVSFTTSGEVVLMLSPAGLLRLADAPLIERPNPRTVEPARESALVVDDSISVRHGLSRQLRSFGYQVDEASDGEQALRLLRERSYRLVLTDLEMPRMDGFEFLNEIKQAGLATGIALVVASTCNTAEVRRRVSDLGARAFLVKPVDGDALAQALAVAQPLSSPFEADGGAAVGPNMRQSWIHP